MPTGRRLAAIMFTDIVGYTALAQKDESLALRALEKHNLLLRLVLKRHHGREVKTMGDAFLVEFGSALDATNCALEIQQVMHDSNLSSKEPWKTQVRIGIHLGDVVTDARIHKFHRLSVQVGPVDILGDAVNIASRIQPLAEPEGICISQQVYDQVRNKLARTIVRLGSQELKNLQLPVDVYKIVMPWDASGPA